MWFLHDPSALTLISMDGLQKIHNLRRDPRVHIIAESGARGADIKGVAIRGRAEFLSDTRSGGPSPPASSTSTIPTSSDTGAGARCRRTA